MVVDPSIVNLANLRVFLAGAGLADMGGQGIDRHLRILVLENPH